MALFIAMPGTMAEQLWDPHVLAVQNHPWNKTTCLLVKYFPHLYNQKLESQSEAHIP